MTDPSPTINQPPPRGLAKRVADIGRPAKGDAAKGETTRGDQTRGDPNRGDPTSRSRRSTTRTVEDSLATRAEGRRRRRVSPLTIRILALNVLAVATLFGGLMFLGAYERSLIEAELESLATQGKIFSGALGESAVGPATSQDQQTLNVDTATQMMRRLVAPTRIRARLFDRNGALIADSRILSAPGGVVRIEELPPPVNRAWLDRVFEDIYDGIASLFARDRSGLPEYSEPARPQANDYREVLAALNGEALGAVRRGEHGRLVLTHAEPVQRYKTVVGALMLSKTSAEIDEILRNVRLDIMRIFAVVLALTFLMSIYLARSIVRPLNMLAAAADRMRKARGRRTEIPDMSDRRDEIGDLSRALGELTVDLWRRLDAIERFAADVSHEIKNPLSSLRSAVETASKVKDAGMQRQLMNVILEDVQRLDRLITDISRASRLDTEMSRVQPEPINLRRMLQTLADIHETTAKPGMPKLVLDLPKEPLEITVMAVEDRIVQVFRNIIMNAISFSPPGGVITVAVEVDESGVEVMFEDQG
ncbi:MAG: stimulus-sensing domain-containing protein, partial [Alphaproteobacteria bacterium]